jgi:hypothetical protein
VSHGPEGGALGEIMRWRLTRLPQRRVPAAQSLLALPQPALLGKLLQGGDLADLKKMLAPYGRVFADASALLDYITSRKGDPAVSAAFGQLLQLDQWLAAAAPAPSASPPFSVPVIADLRRELGRLGLDTGSAAGQELRQLLCDLYYLALLSGSAGSDHPSVDVLGLLTRWLLVLGLAVDLQQRPSPILGPDDVTAALRWRTPVLPDAVVAAMQALRARRGSIIVRKPGFADLYVTREEWDHYEAAEIASIENILARELMSRVHVLVNQTKVTDTTEVTTSSLKEQDNTTTDLSQLQQQSSSDISIAASVNGQVDASGQYGPTQLHTQVGGSLDYSSASATSRATTQSHETVARSVSKIEQTTRQVRITSTLSRATDREEHKFDNTGSGDPVVGIYRWVDQIQNVELDRYPHRFLMEFELPEPGAWTRWLMSQGTGKNMISPLPVPLTKDGGQVSAGNPLLSASDLTGDPRKQGKVYYGTLAARYMTSGLTPPPGPLTIAVNISSTKDNGAAPRFVVMNAADTTLVLPAGYKVTDEDGVESNWAASLLYVTGGYEDDPNDVHIDVSVGGGAPVRSGSGQVNGDTAVATPGSVFRDRITGKAGPVSQPSIPVALQGTNLTGFEVNVEVQCEPLEQTYRQWQIDTYDAIVSAYSAMLQAYNQELSSLDFQEANPYDALSPDQNAITITQELKRQTIEMLTGARFRGRGAIDSDPAKAPSTQLRRAAAVAPEIQFLEQAFEWETMSYVCYPYYWAAAPRREELAAITANDQNFADFLRAGSARVVLAARPGFEDQVNLYVYSGILWGGGPVPAPGDDDYLSIADEIKDAQQRPADVTVIDTWQVRLPTTLVWLENDAGLPKNEHPTIDTTPRIGSLVPASGKSGGTVTVSGRNFGDIQGNSTVAFSGTGADVSAWSATSITVTVPAGAAAGPVVVTASGVPSNQLDFDVT